MTSPDLINTVAGRKVVITGVSGFIGARLARLLVGLGAQEIRALVRSSSSRSLIDDLPLRFLLADLASGGGLEDALKGADLVFHLAGLTRGRSREELDEVNAAGTVRLAEAARAAGCARFVLVSSLAAIGPNPAGVAALDENASAAPVTWYGESKLLAEERLRAEFADLPWTIVRPPGVYGPGERDFLTMFRMVQRRFAPILGLSPKRYSFVYSEDLVAALCAVAGADAALHQTYFVAHPEVRADHELLGAIEEALDRRAWKPRLPHLLAGGLAAVNDLVAPLMSRPPLLSGQKMRELLPERWVVSSEKLEREVGFVCPTGLREGVAATAAWYRERGWL